MKATVHPLSNNSLAKSVVAAVIALEAAAADPHAYPRVPASAVRVLRELGEDAIRRHPTGISGVGLETAARLSQSRTNDALQALPGLLALYAPGTVRVVREERRQQTVSYLYHLCLCHLCPA